MSYARLFQLILRHDYFPAHNCPTVEVVPTLESERIMQQLQIRLVRRETGLEAFYDTSGPLTQTDAPPRLSFILRTDDPLFFNYTDLPPELSAGTTHYFTNLTTAGPSGVFVPSAATRLPVRNAAFTVKANQPGREISLFSERGYQLSTSSDQTEIRASSEDAAEFRIDLRQRVPGRYLLLEGDAVLLDFVLLPQSWRPGDLGLISVYLGDTGNGGHHILDGGTVTPAENTIMFTARATTWRYHLIDSSSAGYAAFELLDQASGEVITSSTTSPLTRRMPDGTEAVVLATPHQVALHQRPGQRFTLSMKRKDDGGGTPITMPLPSASADRLSVHNPDSPSDGADDDFYSDMYIYL